MADARLSRRAVKDLDALSDKAARRVADAIERAAANPVDPSLDIKTLSGRKPWRRLRVGDHRVLFRLTDRGRILFVGRVVDRKELEQAVRSLAD